MKKVKTLRKFDRYDVLRVFFLMGERGKVAREKLSKLSGIGEGSIRSILRILSKRKLIVTTRKGSELSSKGKKMFNEAMKLFTLPKKIKHDVFKDGFDAYASVVKKYEREKIKELYKARDFAIRKGCNSAMVLICNRSGSIKIPYVRKWNFNVLHEELEILPNQLVVLTSSKTRKITEKGILSILEYLSEEIAELFKKVTGVSKCQRLA
ncbi:MAG: hypothetical protein J7K98_02985 [Candidatus Aenigmarchaeota archaeon]|nr:hypothetical protein [Candidatus Aenigmarchaeota archaeon]